MEPNVIPSMLSPPMVNPMPLMDNPTMDNPIEKSNKERFDDFMNDNVLPFQWDYNFYTGYDDEDEDSFHESSYDEISDGSGYSSVSSNLGIPLRTRSQFDMYESESLHSEEEMYDWECSLDQSSLPFTPAPLLDRLEPLNTSVQEPSLPGSYPEEMSTFVPGTSDKVFFTPQRWSHLKLHISRHFQLLVQVYLLSMKSKDSRVSEETWTLLSTFRDTFSNPSHPFYVEGIETIDTLLNPSTSNKDVHAQLEPFSPYFSSNLRIEIDRNPNNKPPKKWTPAEDKLLAIGFDRYQKNWEVICSTLLPTKEVKSIKSRFKNKTSKKARDNPIKQAYAFAISELSEEEEVLLYRGISIYGVDLEMISKVFLPHRKPFWLKKLWQRIYSKKKRDGCPPYEALPDARRRRNYTTYEEQSQSESSEASSEDDTSRKRLKNIQGYVP